MTTGSTTLECARRCSRIFPEVYYPTTLTPFFSRTLDLVMHTYSAACPSPTSPTRAPRRSPPFLFQVVREFKCPAVQISNLLIKGRILLWRIKGEYARLVYVDEGRKRVLLIAASILAARKLTQWDGRRTLQHPSLQFPMR